MVSPPEVHAQDGLWQATRAESQSDSTREYSPPAGPRLSAPN